MNVNVEPDHEKLLPELYRRGFQIEFSGHAKAILKIDFPDALTELDRVIGGLSISIESLVRSGGGEHELTQGLRRGLGALGWPKHNFEITKVVDGIEKESISHEIDHVRTFPNGKVALEIEWNNKDPFFDRDLENFKRLHAEGVISVGVILTRGKSLQDNLHGLLNDFAAKEKFGSIDDLRAFGWKPTERQALAVAAKAKKVGRPFGEAWADVFFNDKFGQASTHWRKLDDRVRRGVGNPCPLLLIGIPASAVTT